MVRHQVCFSLFPESVEGGEVRDGGRGRQLVGITELVGLLPVRGKILPDPKLAFPQLENVPARGKQVQDWCQAGLEINKWNNENNPRIRCHEKKKGKGNITIQQGSGKGRIISYIGVRALLIYILFLMQSKSDFALSRQIKK